jgi:hypothetical protein
MSRWRESGPAPPVLLCPHTRVKTLLRRPEKFTFVVHVRLCISKGAELVETLFRVLVTKRRYIPNLVLFVYCLVFLWSTS